MQVLTDVTPKQSYSTQKTSKNIKKSKRALSGVKELLGVTVTFLPVFGGKIQRVWPHVDYAPVPNEGSHRWHWHSVSNSAAVVTHLPSCEMAYQSWDYFWRIHFFSHYSLVSDPWHHKICSSCRQTLCYLQVKPVQVDSKSFGWRQGPG